MSAEPKEQEEEQEEGLEPVHEGFIKDIVSVRLNQDNGKVYMQQRYGWVLGDTGLGYYQHATTPIYYRPTHLKTGYALSWDFMTLGNCQEYLKEIAPLLDWNSLDEKGPPKEMRGQLINVRKKYLANQEDGA